MGTRIVDAHGEPFPTVEVRRRMGFMGGDLIEEHDTASSVTPPERTYEVGHDERKPSPIPDRVFGQRKDAR